MAHRTYFLQDEVADATFTIDNISKVYTKGIVSVTFYSDEYVTPVTPSAGSLIIRAAEDTFNYGDLDNGTIDITTQQYDRPFWAIGAIDSVQGVMTGVTGATHFALRVDVSE